MPTLAEQVAALEAERDAWRKRADIARSEYAAAESRLASARVEAFKAGWNDFADVAKDFGIISVPHPNDKGPHDTHICGIGPEERFAKLYPAPAAPAGEQTP